MKFQFTISTSWMDYCMAWFSNPIIVSSADEALNKIKELMPTKYYLYFKFEGFWLNDDGTEYNDREYHFQYRPEVHQNFIENKILFSKLKNVLDTIFRKGVNMFTCFKYDCFERYILNYHGNPVIVENYSDGSYSDDPDECWEIWGSYIFDLKNNKCANIRNLYLYNIPSVIIEEIDKLANWVEINKDAEFDYGADYEKVKEFYLKKIEEYEKMNPKPEILVIE